MFNGTVRCKMNTKLNNVIKISWHGIGNGIIRLHTVGSWRDGDLDSKLTFTIVKIVDE